MRFPHRRWLAVGSTWLFLAWLTDTHGKDAFARPEDEARERAKQTLGDVEEQTLKTSQFIVESLRYNPENLLAAAEVHVRAEQFESAIPKLNKIIELKNQGKASAATEAEARFLLAEAYFLSGELYSARREYFWVVERGDENEYSRLAGPAISRLVDVALRVQRDDELSDILEKIDELSKRKESDALRYARAKALFAMGRHEEASLQAAQIETEPEYVQRGFYLRGVSLMRSLEIEARRQVNNSPPSTEGDVDLNRFKQPAIVNYSEAINVFLKATIREEPQTESDIELTLSTGARRAQKELKSVEREVSDLSWLAVARLYYEQKSYLRASNAYGKINRTSSYYARALFELAWTYVRLADYERAERVLDVLSVLDPGLLDGADAALLRGDLLLRSGKYARAEAAYEQVRGVYDPLREQIDDYLQVTVDPAEYYDKLTASDIETGYELPPLVIEWAREEAGENRVFAIVDDVARARRLVRESRQMVAVLQAALNTGVRAKVFPELLARLRANVAMINQLSQAEASLARGFDEADNTSHSELIKVRAQRRKLMKGIGSLPTTSGEFSIRQAAADRQWRQVSQKLQRLELESDHLRAIVNSLHQVLGNVERYGLTADAASIERFRAEMIENEKDLAVYRKRIKTLRQEVQIGRVQTGFGDEEFEKDVVLRKQFSALLEKETALSLKHSRDDESKYVKTAAPVLRRVKIIRARLQVLEGQLNAQALEKGGEVSEDVRREADFIEAFAARLDTLDQDARLLVGQVARENFLKVRDRMRNVVMRSDVGLVQHAWQIREKQQGRLRTLLRKRAREERDINNELKEVLDDQEVN